MMRKIKWVFGNYYRSTSVAISTLLALQLALPAGVQAEDTAGADKEPAGNPPTDASYSPYADRDYPTRVYFGDTHHHTATFASSISRHPAGPLMIKNASASGPSTLILPKEVMS